MIRLLLVDDNLEMLESYKLWLSECNEINIIGEATDGEEGVRKCEELNPDVVLMDIRMPPGMDGLEATKLIKQKNNHIKVIISTWHPDQDFLSKAIQCQCNGFLVKDVDPKAFISVIKNVILGIESWGAGLLHGTGHLTINDGKIDESAIKSLTEKEISIVKCLVRGLKNIDIAKELNYCEGYVRQIIVQIKDKLELENTKALVAWGARMGL